MLKNKVGLALPLVLLIVMLSFSVVFAEEIDTSQTPDAINTEVNVETKATDNSSNAKSSEETVVITVDEQVSSDEDTQTENEDEVGLFSLDIQPPTVPSELHVDFITSTAIAIEWNASLDNNGVECYSVYNGSYLLGTTNSLSYVIENVANEDVYMLSVRAKDYAGNLSDPSNILCVYHIIGGTVVTQILTAPTNLQVDRVWQDKLTLVWQGMENAGEDVSYEVCCNDSSIGSTSDTSYVVEGLENEKAYAFKVASKNLDGQSSGFSNIVCVYHVQEGEIVQEQLLPPTNLMIDSTSQNSVTLKWNSPSYTSNVKAYEIYDEDRKIGETSANTYTITGLVNEDTYVFSVKSKDYEGNVSAGSNIVCLYHVCEEVSVTEGLIAPVLLPPQANDVTSNSINLTWYASQNGSGNITYSVIVNGNCIAENVSGTSYKVKNLILNTAYSIKLVASDAEGNTAESNSLSVTTRESSVVNINPNSINLNCVIDKQYNVIVVGKNVTDLSNKVFSLKYDPKKLEIVDMCSFTKVTDTSVSAIAGTSIIITENQNGVIKFKLNKNFDGKQWTGVVNAIKFKSKVTGGITTLTQEIE